VLDDARAKLLVLVEKWMARADVIAVNVASDA
jgi:hypothetical protein